MNIRQPKRLSRTLISFVAVFALIAQPAYAFVASKVASAVAVTSQSIDAGTNSEVREPGNLTKGASNGSAQVSEQPAVKPEITALKPVLWSGDNYKGISIDTRFVNVTDLQGATITVNREGGSTVTKTMKQARIDAINAANGAALSLTVPFTIQEMTYSEADSGSWSLPSTKEWTAATVPTSVEISFVFADSSKNVNETAQMNDRGIDYISLLPPVDSTPQTTLVTPTGIVGSKFKITGTATDNEALNRVYVQLVNREDHKRYGGTTVNLIGKGVEADWSVEYDTKKQNLPEGRYAAHVAVVDMKGNTSSQGWSENFIVDATAPVFNSVSPTTGTAINKDFTVTADVTDKVVGVQKIALYVINTETNKKVREYAMTKGADNKWSANVKLADLDGDAVYDLRFRAVDSVNNVTYHNNRGGAYLVTVDTTGPEIHQVAPDANDALVGDKLSLRFNVQDDPAGIRNVNIHVFQNGKTQIIVPLEHIEGDIWGVDDYDISELDEGRYTFVSRATDNLRNTRVGTGTNHGSIIVDKTAPDAQLKASISEPRVGDKIEVTGFVTNEPHIKSHWFEITQPDGKTQVYVTEMNTSEKSHTFTLNTSAGAGEYKIRYVATDRAGNRSDASNYSKSKILSVVVASADEDNTGDGENSDSEGAPDEGEGPENGDTTGTETGSDVEQPNDFSQTITDEDLPSPLARALSSLATPASTTASNLSFMTALAQATPTPQVQAITEAGNDEEVLGTATNLNQNGEVLGVSTDGEERWSLLNAIAVGIAVLLGILALLGMRRTSEDENVHAGMRIMTAAIAAAGVVALFMTENFATEMGWMNGLTWVFGLGLVVQVILLIMAHRTASE